MFLLWFHPSWCTIRDGNWESQLELDVNVRDGLHNHLYSTSDWECTTEEIFYVIFRMHLSFGFLRVFLWVTPPRRAYFLVWYIRPQIGDKIAVFMETIRLSQCYTWYYLWVTVIGKRVELQLRLFRLKREKGNVKYRILVNFLIYFLVRLHLRFRWTLSIADFHCVVTFPLCFNFQAAG